MAQTNLFENYEILIDVSLLYKVKRSRVESDLDIFATQPISTIPDLNIANNLLPFDKCKKLFIDIETTGLNPDFDRIVMIGVWDGINPPVIFTDEDESRILEEFSRYMNDKAGYILIGHNLIEFDIPFIMKRYHNNMMCSEIHINIGKNIKKVFKRKLNRYIEIKPVYIHGMNILDTMYACMSYDRTANILDNYKLKDSVINLGLRKSRRTELSHDEIQKAWNNKNIEIIKEYLIYDLEDTKLLSDFLHPIIYYQQMVVQNISLQDLALSGDGWKWELILENYYGPQYKPQRDNKIEYEGGLVVHNKGLYCNVGKLDVSSLYPSIMMAYRICSRKDVYQYSLQVLKYLTNERLRLKQLAKQGNKEAEQKQGALKALINSAYGFLGSEYYMFNDYKSASKVTEYGRLILQHMMDKIESLGGVIIEADTDGIFYQHPNIRYIFDEVQKSLPVGINIELEYDDVYAIYVPKKKNYIIFKTEDEYIVKGSIFKGKNICRLQKEFPIEYIKKYLCSPKYALGYYHSVKRQVIDYIMPIDMLKIKRRINKNDKVLLQFGKLDDVVEYYTVSGGYIGQSGKYDIKTYVKMIDEIRCEIDKVIFATIPYRVV
ncbi:MAG: ribonuclease H-like domain-containing protein [Nitrospirae bacterium]|nr:ribonuclease H-like domain-containing protein [Nitrospirota bacterium]